jgi:hypothetical protein
MTCPACGRPVAIPRAQCLYCGAALPPENVAQANARARESSARRAAPDPFIAGGAARALVIIDCGGADAETVGAAVGVSRFQADLRVRQGGYQLHRIATLADAHADAERCAALGLWAALVPEAEARAAARPVIVLGGRIEPPVFALRTDEGPVGLEPSEIVLVVRGPIVREYLAEPSTRHRRKDVGLEGGHRIHFHRRADPRPLELDPGSFEFDAGGVDSSLRRLTECVVALGERATVEDGFRRLAPALAPAETEARGALSSAEALRPRSGGSKRKDGPRVVLDNVAQFRFYSAWRGAVERLRKVAPG